jgi:hypothetical protein
VSFLGGLLAGRSHLAFLVGLAGAAATAGAVHRLTPEPRTVSFESLVPRGAGLPLRPQGPLDARERALAQAAWTFLDRNTDPVTGLAASVEGHPATTMWDLGSQLLGVLAAEDLGLVSRRAASERLARALRSLAAIPLCDGLPNKVYDTRTLEMVRYDGRPAPDGIGWSALDIARVLLPLSVVAVRHPELAPSVRRAVSRWRLDALTDGGVLRGATRRPDGGLEVWARRLANGDRAVILFNRGQAAAEMAVSWQEIGLPYDAAVRVRDVWTKKEAAGVKGRFVATVGPHEVVMIRVEQG